LFSANSLKFREIENRKSSACQRQSTHTRNWAPNK